MAKRSRPAQQRNRLKLLKYLGNPDNPYLARKYLSTQVCGYATESAIYMCFTPAELNEIEKEALDIRRQQYANHISKVDLGLLKKAAEGDAASAKLVYQRFEKWVPVTESRNTGADGGPIQVTITPEVEAIINRIRADVEARRIDIQAPEEDPDDDED